MSGNSLSQRESKNKSQSGSEGGSQSTSEITSDSDIQKIIAALIKNEHSPK